MIKTYEVYELQMLELAPGVSYSIVRWVGFRIGAKLFEGPISANPISSSFFFFYWKTFSRMIFSILLRASNL